MKGPSSKEEIELSEISTLRKLAGFDRVVQGVLGVALIVMGALFTMNVDVYLGITLFKEQYIGTFIAGSLCLIFLGVRPTKRITSNKVPWYDYILAVAGLAAGLYLTVKFPELINRMGYITVSNVVFGSLFIGLSLEAIRRMQGWSLVILVLCFIFYALFANYFPSVLNLSATSFPRLISYLYLEPSNTLALVGIAADIALAFVFFGQILFTFDGIVFIRDFSFSVIGRFRGAPAKVAVVASGLFGTISGGAAVNVMVTGSFTIPMMKASGYKPHIAGGVEAIASSGGQIMPPVMGVAAFLIAEFLRIPYSKVALAAVIPALLYYIAVYVQVDLDAAKFGITGLAPEKRPPLGLTLWRSWPFFIPMALLVYFLFIVMDDPAKAGMETSLLTIVVNLISKKNRTRFWRKLLDTIEGTARTMLTVTAILAGAGLIVAVTSITGLGSIFSILVLNIAGENTLFLLIISAIACILLGMGMPTVPAYTLVAVLVGPALIQMGVLPLAAHLFIFYFAVVSNVTPPVALAAYVGAALAEANAIKTAFTGMRLGIVAFLVPFLFIYCPALLLVGSVWQIAIAFLSAVVGVWFLGVGLSGYLFLVLGWPKRLLALVVAISFFFPLVSQSSVGWVSYLVGTGLGILLLASDWRRKATLVSVARPV